MLADGKNSAGPEGMTHQILRLPLSNAVQMEHEEFETVTVSLRQRIECLTQVIATLFLVDNCYDKLVS